MGPRPFSRGDKRLMSYYDLINKLQWGRDLSVAETLRDVQYFASSLVPPLQWGRDLSVAETRSRALQSRLLT